jgi:branched-chain amino acid transport system permease protein
MAGLRPDMNQPTGTGLQAGGIPDPAPVRRLLGQGRRTAFTLALTGLVLAAAPLVLQADFQLTFLTLALYTTLLGAAWNLLGGFGGQYSFGHAVFFGTGAYASAILQVHAGVPAWVGLPAGIALGALTGAALGAVSFRYGLRGSYFALVTLAMAEVFRIVANSVPFTGAGVGMMIPLADGLASLQFGSRRGYYWLALAFAMAGLALTAWVRHSRFGAALVAVRDNEEAARALGINATRVKIIATTLSAALMAAAGVFYLQLFHYIDPALVYGPGVSVDALLAPIVGGMGTVFGPLIGAFALAAINELSTRVLGEAPALSMALYGLILILMVTFLPRGLAHARWPWRRDA